MDWLYRRNLERISIQNEQKAEAQAKDYVHLYVLAETCEMPELQDSIMNLFRARPTCALGWFPTLEVSQVYKGTSETSPLRAYIIDTFIFKSQDWTADDDNGGRLGELTAQLEAGNREFVLDCYEALVIARGLIEDPNKKPSCTYHVHEEGNECK